MKRFPRQLTNVLIATFALAMIVSLPGCFIFGLTSVMGQAFEDQKLIEKLAEYDGLAGHDVAVIVDAPLDVLYEHPNVIGAITTGVTYRLGRDVPDIRVVIPENIISWQWQNPDWNLMAYGELAESLNVDRIVHIDIYEYRLHPPGNRWLWDGVCAATVSVVERDGFDPDSFAQTFDIAGRFPNLQGVERSMASAQQIQTGVLAEFIKKTSWLFHKHVEPKHPDRYRPELDA